MDVAVWLKDLKLERYVSAFRDSDIDAEVLPKLAAEDRGDVGQPTAQAARRDCQPPMAVPTAVVAALAPLPDWHKSTPNAGRQR
jgi:hypothetical protein